METVNRRKATELESKEEYMIKASLILESVCIIVLMQAVLLLLEKQYDLKLVHWKRLIVSKSVLLVTLGTVVTEVLFVWFRREDFSLVQIVLQAVLIWGMAILTIVDYKLQLIPNRFLLLLAGLWILVLAMFLFFDASSGFYVLAQSLLGGVIGAVIFGICYLLSRKQLGAGDVKLAIIMGLYLTPSNSIGAYLIGTILCCVYSLLQILRKKIGWKDSVPMVPFLTVGTWVALFLFG
jgi:prepilin signal peptidase PulO-like enzyme (type II secretory pathway)